ncbi:MAG TPA: tetratricopeptide repeat protein [Xanthobacteraceae bacterium]|nr:tetratricopeptide repeat protein [Xanthobacteraceae bacterium]
MMHRRLSTVALLVSLALAATAQICAGAPLPAAQSASRSPLVAKAQAALDAKQWPDAEAALKQLSSSEPRWEYFEALGAAQFNQGHYADSLDSYQRAIDLAQKDLAQTDPAGKSANAAAIAQMYTTIGNANLKLKKNDAAIAAYTKAATLSPNPAVAYFNLCATMYNMGQPAAKTVAFCDKAIAADPKKADAYFVKGSALYGEGALDKSNKFVPPPGSVEALKQYLVLAPDGPHVQDVKAMLDALK